MTAVRIDLTLDCGDAQLLAAFWKSALGYVDLPPPPPFATREEWLAQFDLPEGETADDGAWLCDPEGIGPRLSILKVPEPKAAKNRLHIDVRIAGHGTPAERGPASGRRPRGWWRPVDPSWRRSASTMW